MVADLLCDRRHRGAARGVGGEEHPDGRASMSSSAEKSCSRYSQPNCIGLSSLPSPEVQDGAMSDESAASIRAKRRDWMVTHRDTYLQSGGTQGHVMDISVWAATHSPRTV